MDNESESIIETQSFWAGYRNQKVVQDVTMSIPETGVTAIIGPSGCGKSTLIGSLNRVTDLQPGFRSGGKVTFRGRNIHSKELDVVELRKKVGLIFQRPAPFPLSVFANLEIPLQEHYRLSPDDLNRRVKEQLEVVGLLDELDDPHKSMAEELSGGQQQRLCIARALTLNPEVLLCDEPCSSLDPVSGERVERLLLELSQSIAVVIVTHNLFQAKRLADQVLFFCVKDGVGRLVEQGSADQIFNHPTHKLTQKYVSGTFG